jgi:hypothetical protein
VVADACVSYFAPVQRAGVDTLLEPDVSPFLCHLCLRTRRPSFSDLLSLLLTLQKLAVWLPEGVAVQYLADRAMSWLERVRSLIVTDEVSEARRLAPTVEHRLMSAARLGHDGNLFGYLLGCLVESIDSAICPDYNIRVVYLLTAECECINMF